MPPLDAPAARSFVLRQRTLARFVGCCTAAALHGCATERPATPPGTTAPPLRAIVPRDVGYSSALAAVTELRQRRVALVVHDAPVVIRYASGDEANLSAAVLDDDQLGWGTRRGDEKLLTAVNVIATRWRADGTRDHVPARWLPYWHRLEASQAPR